MHMGTKLVQRWNYMLLMVLIAASECDSTYAVVEGDSPVLGRVQEKGDPGKMASSQTKEGKPFHH